MFKQKLYVFLVFALLFSSCGKKSSFPEKFFEKLSPAELGISIADTMEFKGSKEFLTLNEKIKQFSAKDKAFSLKELEQEWVNTKGKDNSYFTSNVWIKATGLLMELTGDAKYAEEMELKALQAEDQELQKSIAPYILGKRMDHIYVNLFQEVKVGYEHSLGGNVSFMQETDYPKSGSIKLHLGMTKRRYIELYVRIPSWAEGTTVTVKQVKYFTAPGTYCKIAKKWKEGDLVEIEFPKDKIPY